MLHRLTRRWSYRAHRQLFHWQCQTFFSHQHHLLPVELDFLEACWDASTYKPQQPMPGSLSALPVQHYTHTFTGHEADDSGLMVGAGALLDGHRARYADRLSLADVVLGQRGVSWPSVPDSWSFWGFSWQKGRLERAWWWCEDISQCLETEVRRCWTVLLPYRPSSAGLIGYTLAGADTDDATPDVALFLLPQHQTPLLWPFAPQDPSLPFSLPKEPWRLLMGGEVVGMLQYMPLSHRPDWPKGLHHSGRQRLIPYLHKAGVTLTMARKTLDDYTVMVSLKE